ncbi:hypothetical protein XnspCFBP7698_12590 [Xanthomonas sp. CFBP 7698]|nr:hypothetical protein XnspCFBP7698_12590 [Xanthomonas sp. CFBP 7698]
MVGVQAFNRATSQPCDAVSSLFSETTNQVSGLVSSWVAGPLAAWMPPPSLLCSECGSVGVQGLRGHRTLAGLGSTWQERACSSSALHDLCGIYAAANSGP